MAHLPTIKELQDTLIDIFSYFHNGQPRPNDGLLWGSIQGRWSAKGYRADDFDRLIQSMKDAGTLEVNANDFYILTEKAVTNGLISQPSIAEIEMAVLNVYSDFNIRENEGLPDQTIWLRLQNKGFTGEQYSQAKRSLFERGLITTGANEYLLLTKSGFMAMP